MHAVSLLAYLENHAGSLMFQKDERITVLERNPSGNWRGFILQNDLTTRFGYFPSTYVRLIDRMQKPQPTTSLSSCTRAVMHALNSGKLSKFIANPIAQLANIDEITCDISPIGSIDSSSKVSTSSNPADSGISSYKSLNQPSPPHSSLSIVHETLNNQIYDSTSIIAKTLSSSTLRSFTNSKTNFLLPSLNENIYSPSSTVISAKSPSQPTDIATAGKPIDITEIMTPGATDGEIILSWLKKLNLDVYFEKFVDSGYDLITATKMTPSDLIAIGVSDPFHRRTLISGLKRLNLKDFDEMFSRKVFDASKSIKALLDLIHLDEYLKPIIQQGYLTVSDLLLVNCEDLEDIGIKKLGHQKRFLSTIKRLQSIDLADEHPAVAVSGINHARSCENVAILSMPTNDHTKQKPVPPKRNDSIVETTRDHIQATKQIPDSNPTTSFYATLPRKRSNLNQKPVSNEGKAFATERKHDDRLQAVVFATGSNNAAQYKQTHPSHQNIQQYENNFEKSFQTKPECGERNSAR